MRGKIVEQYLAIGVFDTYFARRGLSWTGKKNADDGVLGLSKQEQNIFEFLKNQFDLDFDELKLTNNWKHFDTHFTNKVYIGPEKPNTSVHEYYNNTSCFNFIPKVKIPTLVIHSRDDPIIDIDCMSIQACMKNENFIVGVTQRGSHVQYF